MQSMNTTAINKFGDYRPDPRLRKDSRPKPWLDRLKIAHGTSKITKAKKAHVGDFHIDDLVLGETTKIMMGPSRPHAIWLDPNNNWKKQAESFDIDDADYQKIVAAEDSGQKGARRGPEFLLYMVEQDKFVTFHLTGMAAGEDIVDNAYLASDQAEGKFVVELSTKAVGSNETPVPVFTVTDEEGPAIDGVKAQRAFELFTAFKKKTGAQAAGAGDRPR